MDKPFVQSNSPALLQAGMPLIDKAMEHEWNHIVDFGCGYGLHVGEFSRRGRQATGIDISFTDEALADANVGGYALEKGDWINYAHSFDAGFSHHCLEHLRDPVQGLHEWGWALKPGSKMFIAVPNGSKGQICAGHLTPGWSVAHLLYNCAVAGFNCRDAEVRIINGSTMVVVSRGEYIAMTDTHVFGWGEEVKKRLPESWTRALCTSYVGSNKWTRV